MEADNRYCSKCNIAYQLKPAAEDIQKEKKCQTCKSDLEKVAPAFVFKKMLKANVH